MEQTRLFLAVALTFLVFVAWELFFVDKTPVITQKQPSDSQMIDQQQSSEADNDNKLLSEQVRDELQTTGLQIQAKPRVVTVNTSFYSVKISEQGAVFTSLALNNYKETINDEASKKEIIADYGIDGAIKLTSDLGNIQGLDNAVFVLNNYAESIDIHDNPQNLKFSWVSSNGIVVNKIFRFFPDSYLIDLDVYVENRSEFNIKDSIILSMTNQSPDKDKRYSFVGPSNYMDKHYNQIKIKKIKEQSEFSGEIEWISFQKRYFMSAIIPKEPVKAMMRLTLNNNIVNSQYVQPVSIIKAGELKKYSYSLFFGPMSLNILKELGLNLDKAVNFGMFDFLAKPCLYSMNIIHKYIPNYGIAIILLTVFIKIILWPLGTKSYKSMNEMKKIQPLMAEIRTKYKNDKKKMNQEVMGLYKTYKVNPVGGCLPMLVQIPVFFAFYRMLYQAIELRHAPFLGWVTDLSAPDRLFNFNISIPFMQPPYGIPVLTIIMGGTMFLQQKMAPPMGDPAQAKIMMFMPIVFTVIFINFSSGLVLYWLVNNILSISQQYYISQKFS